jgi:FkbM family methyltransferase
MNLLRGVCHLLGYELIKARKSPSLRSHLKNIFDRYRIDVVLDVGANLGQFATMIRKAGYRGRIYSFEPVTASFERLLAAARGDDQWHVFKLGLGDQQARLDINLSRSSDLNSLLAASDYGKTRYPKIEANARETIEIDTLDHFMASNDIPGNARIFLKMDTQGYDLKVFDGARNSLGRVSALLSELSLIPIYENAPHWLDALACYERGGFRVSGLYPVSRNSDLSVIEVDCVLVSNSAR